MSKKRIFWCSDGVTPTGFSTVAHNIINNLPQDDYEIHHLGVNYWGDPHPYQHFIYPAGIKGDVFGVNRIKDFVRLNFDGIFILNDLWMVDIYLDEIKKTFKEIPPIVVYFPVDTKCFQEEWFKNFDIVKKAVVYTQFGYEVVKEVVPNIEFNIIPHGIDTNIFFKIMRPKEEIKRMVFQDSPEFYKDSFIVLNAN